MSASAGRLVSKPDIVNMLIPGVSAGYNEHRLLFVRRRVRGSVTAITMMKDAMDCERGEPRLAVDDPFVTLHGGAVEHLRVGTTLGFRHREAREMSLSNSGSRYRAFCSAVP